MSRSQFHLWHKMIQLIQDFYKGKALFHSLVSGLQKYLDMAKLNDPELVRKWYAYFNPLEEADWEAWYEMEDPDYEKIDPFLRRMKEFLLEQEQNFWAGLRQSRHRKLI